MEIYRGDTFKVDFTATLDGSVYQFKTGDTLKVGVKDKLSNTKLENLKNYLEKQKNVASN